MENTATQARYSRGAVAFHWIIALLIAVNYALAWLSEDLPKPERLEMMGNHKALGITILLLTVARLGWRLVNPPPAMVTTLRPWEVILAKVTHGLFYFFMLAIPLAGWGLHSSAGQGKPVSMFGLFPMPALPVGTDKPTVGLYHELHEVFGTLLLVLIGIHVLAALKHQFIDRDPTLARMVPWLR